MAYHATNYEEISDRPGAVELAKSINNTAAKAVNPHVPGYDRIAEMGGAMAGAAK